ncbi:hypothetical protein O1611_g1792 [Lasiodiplodia mahajangana]|uniref:Uncharacterized protein n=1 Tax=Lasiodiplodia mahajangana TaxID=1108764 RepID=A0ACC2JWQ9_9PEZI|nr:hypothetical protein O1611_g1792 [Lasiodiplodia mahajangana]
MDSFQSPSRATDPATLHAGSIYLREQYDATKNLRFLLQATAFSEGAIAATTTDDPMRSDYLSTSVSNLTRQFLRTKDPQVLGSAIERAREALVTYSGGPDMRRNKVQNVAFLLEEEIKLVAGSGQVSGAVALAKKAVDEIPDDHRNHTRLLGLLAQQLWQKYDDAKQEQDLFETIEKGEEALSEAQRTTALNPVDMSVIAKTLCVALEYRYIIRGSGDDLKRLFSLLTGFSVDSVAEQAKVNCMRARYLAWRYRDHGGSMADLNRAVELSKFFSDIPRGEADRISNLDYAIIYFCMKYDHDGQVSGLDEITALIHREMNAISPLELRPHLHNLNLLRIRRYAINGSLEELNEAIQDYKKALSAMDDKNEMRPGSLSNLGYLLCMRYERLGERDALEESIERCYTAVDATRDGDPQLTLRKSNLATCLAQKYVRTELLRDLGPVIELGRAIIEAMPETLADRFKYLNNLGVWLSWSYMQTKEPAELDEGIAHIRNAIEQAPRDHVVRIDCLNNLCACLKMRYDRGEPRWLVDLDDAIQYGQEAVAQLPSHHAMKTRNLRNLFGALKTKYEETHDDGIRNEVLGVVKQAVESEGSPPSHRLNFVFDDAVPWLLAHNAWEELSRITELAVSLLSNVSPRSLRQQDQQYLLRRYAGLASTAAAAALEAGKSGQDALRLLEHGRGTITSILLQNRRSISSLQRQHPNWAKKFEGLRDALDPPLPIGSALVHATQSSTSIALSPEDRYRTAEELNELLKKIRADDAFKNFLLPLTTLEMMSAARENQAIVVINIARFRCDAFLIQSNEVSIINLTGLTAKRVETEVKRFRDSRSRKDAFQVLEWLWAIAMEKILARLGADKPCFGRDYSEWPRVYWVPTGPLRLLPIHAAGYHCDGTGRSVLDRVVSSYSLSVEEILHGQEIKAQIQQTRKPTQVMLQPQDKPGAACKFVLVSMESTRGSSRLPYAPEEVHAVSEMLPPCLPHESLDRPLRDNLLRTMSSAARF